MIEKAKTEISQAWEKLKAAKSEEILSLEVDFGKTCQFWHDWYIQKPKDKGDRIRFLWKSLSIPHTAAYSAMASYRLSDPEYKIPVVDLSQEEIKRSEIRADNEARLEQLFTDCGFPFQIRQNCATKEYHFNVIFTSLSEKRVGELASIFKKTGAL